MGLTSLFFTNSALAQEVKPNTEIVENKNSLDKQDSAQWIEITGTVTDDYGPMGGVVVMEKGTKNVVPADDNGNFSIKIPKESFQNPVFLLFKSFGNEDQEFEVFKSTKNKDYFLETSLAGVAGGIMSTPIKQTFFRRLTKPFRITWWKMKRKFRNN